MAFSKCYPNQSPVTVFNLTMWDIFPPLKVTSLLLGWGNLCFSFLFDQLLYSKITSQFSTWSYLINKAELGGFQLSLVKPPPTQGTLGIFKPTAASILVV